MNEQFKLCYVSYVWAWFTTCPLDKQWGDDWNDAPYEHNAGSPYRWQSYRDVEAYELLKVAFDGPFEQPCDHHLNSPYSVEMINAGAVAWLRSERWMKEQIVIPAGTSLPEFIRKVQQAGGTVYTEVSKVEE